MGEPDKFDSLVDQVFDKEQLESADFEIAFTATLATAVLATLSGDNIPILVLKLMAVALISITLVRRMAVSSRFANEDRILSTTMPLIEFLTIMTTFHLMFLLSNFITSYLPHIQEPFTTSVILIPATILLLMLFQELVLRNYLIWWGWYCLAFAANTENSGLKALGGMTALSVFRYTPLDDLPEELNTAAEIVDEYDERLEEELDALEYDVSPSSAKRATKLLLWTLALIVISVIYFATAFLLSIILGTIFQVFLLLFSILFVRHIVRFFYLAYGLPDEGQIFYSKSVYSIGSYIFYAVPIWYLFV